MTTIPTDPSLQLGNAYVTIQATVHDEINAGTTRPVVVEALLHNARDLCETPKAFLDAVETIKQHYRM